MVCFTLSDWLHVKKNMYSSTNKLDQAQLVYHVILGRFGKFPQNNTILLFLQVLIFI